MSHYISITDTERAEMLEAIGVAQVRELFHDVPKEVRFPTLQLPAALSEMELQRELHTLAAQNANAMTKSIFLGAGAYHHFVPSAIDQILRRSEYYTAYTPYQPEVSQGTLQAIFEYQSLVSALTGMDIANASHYDGGTAMAEAAIMAVASTRKRRTVVVAPSVHPQYRQVLRTLLQGTNIHIVGDEKPDATLDDTMALVNDSTAALIVQSPDFFGTLHDLKPIADKVHDAGALLIGHFDPIALGLFQTPGEADVDIATAEGQPLGVGLSFGGPYLGIFTCKEKFVRKMPGRLTGATLDVDGNLAYVLTLRAREQDIRRETATSNICTNQGLMALAAAVYLSLMGRQGVRKVAELCYHRAHYAATEIGKLAGYEVLDRSPFFKEFVVQCPQPVEKVNASLNTHNIIGGYDLSRDYPQMNNAMLLCVTEMNTKNDIDRMVAALSDIR
ncbi:MAG: aminomethyl-transferring glycine dehydrogenase subunit GcvPA [Chloroflexi bacterium AL-W]|nr:aminomethyl-transferring glycine dehydrogenase subunit GcvPA [Chloroflexi bacterium AL-N1]NOK66925.1 aminomethyl-transferring glycine dehydrogenase subunit GcvPA [Chloroflexi bacterium AL-N10]NOK74783.1 aminomethyl-transferring glycine dehydrogenase subunit GcvPA [Chloroflexi bacterium AL-N5]NOK81527.1 aminomethyl-transferring glycine dehydrogenase subunit GcvPA [Chloroflexi bacterium AL-W]NOK88997.1 aminomethyl-transferring glycine dehydrogenase subunit GcvPA [Chloroflexi bacterium AL-N15]